MSRQQARRYSRTEAARQLANEFAGISARGNVQWPLGFDKRARRKAIASRAKQLWAKWNKKVNEAVA